MKRFMYTIYLIVWNLEHFFGKGVYKGCEPSCYGEWLDNEWQILQGKEK